MMGRLYYLLLFLLGSSSLWTQETLYGCITIDFENIPGEIDVYEGLSIGSQYYNEFGLTFELETGGIPVLAEIGNPRTAYHSAWGSDTPNPFPDQGLGRFFITDDGVLAGLYSPPIILNFETPIDSFAGCIQDMDFGEQFIIHARDQFKNIILSDTIEAGDPGTGDGISTCWGFNLDGCIGTIYSIRFEGKRETLGGFGMGLDNFSFCYSGINIASTTIQPTCLALNGTLHVFSTSNDVYSFSIDGTTFLESGLFNDLGPDIYEIFVRDEFGCETSVPIEIFAAEDPLFVEVDVQHTTCTEDNGAVFFSVTPDIGAQFSIDNGISFEDVSSFQKLAPGDYIIEAVDDNFCTGQLSFTIDPSSLPEIENIEPIRESCNQDDGSLYITVNASSGLPPYEYALEGQSYQSDPNIDGLSDGEYTVLLKDADGCIVSALAIVPPYPSIILGAFQTIDPDCVNSNGEIIINASGGLGNLSFSINNLSPQNSNEFNNLHHGMHIVHIIDEEGCENIDSVFLEIPLCPIYVPNVISGNGDNNNDHFIISVHPDYPAEILCYWIFDRWGELIYESKNYSIHYREENFSNKSTNWWNGYFRGEPAETGVYAYLIELKHENGSIEQLVGTITLLR